MLTICIPVYNNDVRKLVRDLLVQIKELDNGTDILIIDDGSDEVHRSQYPELEHEHTTVIQLEKNMGRARIRNRFPKSAVHPHLLFLDGDSQIINEQFLKNYVNLLSTSYSVVCGGRIYPEKNENKKVALHWRYGKYREARPLAERKLHPARSFMTHNFLVRKEILEAIPFNEELLGYGHEDTLFGFELMKAMIPVDHIDNPVMHDILVPNEEFLNNTDSGIKNLVTILRKLEDDPDFIANVRLLKVYYNMKKSGMNNLIKVFSPLLSPMLRRKLKKGNASLRSFDLYKLCVLAKVVRKKS